jgi:hypothetical protein
VGGYVVAPGSTHVSGRAYAWEIDFSPDDLQLAAMPDWMVEALQRPRGTGDAATDEEWVRRFSGVEEGARNDTATRCAGYLAARGLSAELIAEILLGFGARCTPPIDREEAVQFRDIARRIWDKEQAKRQAPTTSDAPPIRPGWEPQFTLKDGGIWWRHPVGRNRELIDTQFTNVDMFLEADLIHDNGQAAEHVYRVAGRTGEGEALPIVDVPAADFKGMEWVDTYWGTRALILASPGELHRLALAVKTRAPIVHRHVYRHTGWRRIGETVRYLHGRGALGDPSVIVDLGPGFEDFYIDDVSPDAMREGLAMTWQIAASFNNWRILAPLWGTVFRAPLCSIVRTPFALVLNGETQSFKTSLAAVAMCHYGSFEGGAAFRTTWSSTANAMGEIGFILKDTLCPLDDYVRTGVDAKEMERKSIAIFRDIGNAAARQRLTSTIQLRESHPTRGLVLSTSEEAPGTSGSSLRARVCLVPVSPIDIDAEILRRAQTPAAKRHLNAAMAGYLAGLQPDIEDPAFAQRLRDADERFRVQAATAQPGGHRRFPVTTGMLVTALEEALRISVACHALTPEQAATYQQACWIGLIEGEGQRARDVRQSGVLPPSSSISRPWSSI